MIINGTNITGLFKYPSSGEDYIFEKGDFIIYNNCIYICKKSVSTLNNPNPEADITKEFYIEYPGEKALQAEDYYQYLSSGNANDDKYVTAKVLCEILQNTQFGFGDTGIIEGKLDYNSNNGHTTFCLGLGDEQYNYGGSSPLDSVFKENSLNNGFLRVSRDIANTDVLLGSLLATRETIDPNNLGDTILLKQYTYSDLSSNRMYRVQELLDPDFNRIFFRYGYCTLNNGEYDFSENTSISSWREFYNSIAQPLIDRVNGLRDYYEQQLLNLESIKQSLQGKYCYRDLNINPDNTDIVIYNELYTGSDPSVYKISGDDFSNSTYLDILVSYTIGVGSEVYKNYSTTINTQEIVNAGSGVVVNYIVAPYSDGAELKITAEYNSGGTDGPSITFGVLEDGSHEVTTNIRAIYYREYYNYTS